MRLAVHGVKDRYVSEDELRTDYPQYERDVLPPLGKLLNAPVVYVDPEGEPLENVVFPTGNEAKWIRMRTEDFLRILDRVPAQ